MTKKHKVLLRIDDDCEMAEVILNDKTIMEGNYWDFHDGCHLLEKYGPFRGHHGLIRAIALYYGKRGESVELKTEKYEYI